MNTEAQIAKKIKNVLRLKLVKTKNVEPQPLVGRFYKVYKKRAKSAQNFGS